MQGLYERIFYDPEVSGLYTEEAMLRYMLRFETALAKAQAKHGVVPNEMASVIEKSCRVENLNKDRLIADAALGGNPAIPLVKQLTAIVRQKNVEAARYVHLGATSQDVIDTATMLQTKDAFQMIISGLRQLIRQLVALIEAHRDTLMIGRSFLQQARPITFGYKVAGWLDAVLRSQEEMELLLAGGFILQFGGAVGTLSALPETGLQVSETMSEWLQLNLPSKSWHTERDSFSRMATTLGILTGNMGKMAKDISLLMQTEVAEVMEPYTEGRGGSSTMPHKRNPVGCVAILANAARVPALVSTMLSSMLQDHERATGLWHAEWETLAAIVQLTAGCLRKAVEITGGLEVQKKRMLHNLELTKGLVYAENVSFALAAKIGRADAHALVEKYSLEAHSKNMHLKDLLFSQAAVTNCLLGSEIEALFDPAQSVRTVNKLVERVLSRVNT